MVGNGIGQIKGRWNLKTLGVELVRHNIRNTSKTGERRRIKILSVVKRKICASFVTFYFFRSTVKLQIFSINAN